MRLKSARVRMFRNIVDSGEVEIDGEITTLVGKNESGKSAFLDALYRLNPAYSKQFSVLDDYPRWRMRSDSRSLDLEEIQPIVASFEMTDLDKERIEEELGFPLPMPPVVRIGRTYGDSVYLHLDNIPIVATLLAESAASLPGGAPDDFESLSNTVESVISDTADEPGEPTEISGPIARLKQMIDRLSDAGSPEATLGELLIDYVPTFFLFNQWSALPARINLKDLMVSDPEQLSAKSRTALSLVDMSGGGAGAFLEADYETRVAELEASANEITRQVFEFWSQNDTLEVVFDAEPETVSTQNGQDTVITHLQVRIRDRRHQMTTSFGVRSSGFQWFFSFLAAFHEYETREDIIVLLDEPGLGLHGRAQKDFLRFISDRLSQHHQVVYTTHSPFMVEPRHLERVRLVEDDENLEVASTITGDIRVRDRDTLFPLQAALGYDISQALFASGHNLIVEGVSDYIYLTTLSDHLATLGRTPLDEAWNVVPVGGVSKVPTFVALLGTHLDVTVLVDSRPGPNARLSEFARQGLLDETRILSISKLLDRNNVDVEDMFTPGEYLKLYNAAFNSGIQVRDLSGTDGTVRKLTRHLGSDFNHADPSVAMLQIRDGFLSSLADTTLERFERLFVMVNRTRE